MGKTRNLEPTLSHKEERKKQCLLPNFMHATILKTVPFLMSQHMNFLELSGGSKKVNSVQPPRFFNNLLVLIQPNLTYHPIPDLLQTKKLRSRD